MSDIDPFFIDISPIEKLHTRKEWEQEVWKNIVKKVRNAKSQKEAEEILNLITGAPERLDIVYRALTITCLQKGMSYRETGRLLWVSPQTISNIKKGFVDKEYRSLWKRTGRRPKRIRVSMLPPSNKPAPRMGHSQRTKYGKVWIP